MRLQEALILSKRLQTSSDVFPAASLPFASELSSFAGVEALKASFLKARSYELYLITARLTQPILQATCSQF